MNTRENDYAVSFFAAMSAFIAVAESMLPTPVPFLRPGFSNIPVCIGMKLFSFKKIIFIIVFKVLLSSLLRGTLFSYPFLVSIAGNVMFILIAYPLSVFVHSGKISFLSLSVAGAWAHNTGQLLAAVFFIPLQTVLFIGILLLPIGAVTGIITGLLCNNIYNNHLERILGAIRKAKEQRQMPPLP